jgi:hypothetical protein
VQRYAPFLLYFLAGFLFSNPVYAQLTGAATEIQRRAEEEKEEFVLARSGSK